jgi:hypothetical protein
MRGIRSFQINLATERKGRRWDKMKNEPAEIVGKRHNRLTGIDFRKALGPEGAYAIQRARGGGKNDSKLLDTEFVRPRRVSAVDAVRIPRAHPMRGRSSAASRPSRVGRMAA